MMKRFLRLLLPLSFVCSVMAQDVVSEGGMGGTSSSQFPAKEEDDTLFVVDDGPDLDTSCTFRSGGPLIIRLPIRRFVGDVLGDGTLRDHGALVSGGVLSATAQLRMPVYDVDTAGNPNDPSLPPEVDRVYFNDHYVGDLSGETDKWGENQFTVRTEWIKFPARGGPPAENVIRIEIDTENQEEEAWCTAVDWVELEFKAVAPVFLVHGIRSVGEDWEPEFPDALRNHRIPFSLDIDLPKYGSILGNGRILGYILRARAEELGARKCHIIAHSKGGLDTRAFLNLNYDEEELKVLSVHTISTPHRGTPIADFGVNLSVAASVLKPPLTLGIVGLLHALLPAFNDLTTWRLARFNSDYPGVPGGIQFSSFGADADLNHDGRLSAGEAAPYDPEWAAFSHELIGKGERARVLSSTAREWGGETTVSAIDLETAPLVRNDILVSEFSAAAGSHLGTLPANHNTVKSRILAEVVVDRIKRSAPSNLVSLAETQPDSVSSTSLVRDGFQLTPASRTRTYNVTVDATPSVTFFILAASRTLTVTATAPGGATHAGRFMPLENDGTTGGAWFATVANPVPGTWSVTVTESAQLAAPLDVLSTVLLGNAVQSVLIGGSEILPVGKRARLTLVMFDGTRRLTGLTIAAFLRKLDDSAFAPVAVAFRDDGTDADTKAGDGIYEAFATPPTAGTFAVRVEAIGTASTGAFRRSAAAELRVVPRDAEITGFTDDGIDEDFDGLDDRIVITPHAILETAGTYEVFVRLRASNGKELLRSVEAVLPTGPVQAEIAFTAEMIARDLGADGPYTVAEVRYERIVDGEPVPADLRYDLGATAAYTLAGLQHPRIRLTGTGVAKGLDTIGGDGRFDVLEVQLGVVVEFEGTYSWSVVLRDRNGREIAFITGETPFVEGLNTLQLLFPGEAIARNRVHGPWHVTNLVMFGAGQSLVVNDVFTTPAFSANDFGQPPRRRTVRH